MRKIFLILIFMLLAYPISLGATEITEVTSPKYNHKAWLIEEHSLPVITAKFTFKNAGSSHDPASKAGLAYMLADLLDEGAAHLKDEQFKNLLEERAILLNFSVDKDNFYVTLKTLRKHRDIAFELMGLALSAPRLEANSAKRAREQIISSITKDMENPRYIANAKWNEIVFENHQYSIPVKGTPETINNIRRSDLINFMAKNLVVTNMVNSVVGDISKKEIADLMDRYLSVIPAISLYNNVTETVDKVDTFPSKTTVRIEKPIPQSASVFGFKGVGYKDDDFYPAYILNHILGGGGFQSRLVSEVREKKGLAYSVYTYLNPLSHAALFKGYVGTKNESIDESLDLIKKQMENLAKNGITEDELRTAKKYLIGSFPLKMISTTKLAGYLNFMQIEDLGIDFLEKRNSYVESVTISDVNAAAQKFLDTNKLVTVVVGGK